MNKSNTNDLINILGPPSTKSSFDNNVWIYIERKKTNSSIFKLGVFPISSASHIEGNVIFSEALFWINSLSSLLNNKTLKALCNFPSPKWQLTLLSQYSWLLNDLEDADGNRENVPWIVIFAHRPMYSSNGDGDGHGSDIEFREAMEILLYDF